MTAETARHSVPHTPGLRGRIGIIQPAPGVMLEHEWPSRLPAGVLFPVSRIRMSGVTRDGYARLAEAAPEAARDLASASSNLVAYACTIGSLFAGASFESALVERLATAAGKPAISLASTSVRALRSVGARRLAIVTPYTAETNGWVRDYIVSQGFTVAGFVTTPHAIATVGSMSPDAVADFCVAAMERLRDADALWIPCTAIQTLDAITSIEARSGRPAVSGSQALLWHALDLLSLDDPVTDGGRLFDVARR